MMRFEYVFADDAAARLVRHTSALRLIACVAAGLLLYAMFIYAVDAQAGGLEKSNRYFLGVGVIVFVPSFLALFISCVRAPQQYRLYKDTFSKAQELVIISFLQRKDVLFARLIVCSISDRPERGYILRRERNYRSWDFSAQIGESWPFYRCPADENLYFATDARSNEIIEDKILVRAAEKQLAEHRPRNRMPESYLGIGRWYGGALFGIKLIEEIRTDEEK